MELLIVFLLIVLNGVFAMSEMAVVSARKARLQQQAEAGSAGAKVALELVASPNRFLSTVQIGITLIGIMSGAFGEATIAQGLKDWIDEVPALAPYRDAIAFVVVVGSLTFLSLVVGELVPKRLALQDAERIAALISRPMNFLSKLTAPVVYVLGRATDLLLRLLRIQASDEPTVTEEEIHILMASGTDAGIFDEAEQAMVAGVFRLDDLRIDAIMTPRTEIIAFEVDDPADEVRHKIAESGFSRYLVYQESVDNALGIVKVSDLLRRSLTDQPFDLRVSLSQPLFVPESTPASKVLQLFKQKGIHTALVIDEYGGTQGLVTMTDVLEAVVGDFDTPSAVQREDGAWLLDGMMPIDEFKVLFDLKELPYEETHYQTLAGFVMAHEGKIPAAGDHFEWNKLYFEVVDMDAKRIDKMLVKELS
jgi:putative hemolysin